MSCLLAKPHTVSSKNEVKVILVVAHFPSLKATRRNICVMEH